MRGFTGNILVRFNVLTCSFLLNNYNLGLVLSIVLNLNLRVW